MIRNFAKPDFRGTLDQLARVLEREGIAAHRGADRLEKLSVLTCPVLSSAHAREAILAKLSSCYDDDHSHVVSPLLARLRDDGLDDPNQLRQQAAILLDAAETIDRLLKWYVARVKSIKARNLTNDTIVAIMIEWDLRPRETSRQFKAYEIVVSEGAIKQALANQRGRSLPGHEPTLLSFLPALRRNDQSRTSDAERSSGAEVHVALE